MGIATELTRALGIKVSDLLKTWLIYSIQSCKEVLNHLPHANLPLILIGMQWVGTPPLVAAVALAGGLGMLTALTQPSPEALREAIRETRHIMNGREGKFVCCPKSRDDELTTGREYYSATLNQSSRLVRLSSKAKSGANR
jgi:NAD(P)H-dependent flavin oxidoreductase YrpB (nitropropane dioxygenase family)